MFTHPNTRKPGKPQPLDTLSLSKRRRGWPEGTGEVKKMFDNDFLFL
jgi:hypothetical protein